MEILAPCGSTEHIRPAVYCGADAVYLGARALSARAGAENFTERDLRDAVRFCHAHGVRVYQTVNTLVRDNELDLLRTVLAEAADAGVDALIVQDWGVARLVRECMPGMDMHGSTQMSVHTPAGMRFAEKLGLSRVVLARELSAAQIRGIAYATPLGIEVFVHGALCVCVSGQCYMSAMLGGRSGNRGQCAQPCRLDFKTDTRDHALSLKDLSLVENIEELKKAGVTALKIEGRMKRPEYVAASVTAVRAALDGKRPDMDTLRAVFSRSGFTRGYFSGDMSNMRGVRAKEDVAAAKTVLPGLERLYAQPVKRVSLEVSVSIKHGAPVKLEAGDGRISVSVEGDVPQIAVNRPIDEETLLRQLVKLGGTQYEISSLSSMIDGELALPLSSVNDLRRKMVAALDYARLEANTPSSVAVKSFPALPAGNGTAGAPKLRAECRTIEQWISVRELAWQGALPMAVLHEAADRLTPDADRLLIAPPRFISAREREIREKLEGLRSFGYRRILCNNAGHVALGAELGFELHGGFGLNVTNSYAALELKERGLIDLNLSIELKLGQSVKPLIPLGRVVYGRIPLMLLARCPNRDGKPKGGCMGCTPLVDRLGKIFPLRCDGDGVEVLNADILWMADRIRELEGLDFITLQFDREENAGAIARAYINGEAPPPDSFTRGLLYRGVI